MLASIPRPMTTSIELATPDPDAMLYEHRRKLARETRKVVLIQLALLIFGIGAWELLVRFGGVRELLVGQPTRVADHIVSMWKDHSLVRHTWITVAETLVGSVSGFVLGAACGLLLWWSKPLERALDPVMVVLNSLPKIALTPIFLLWFGVGFSMKVALILSTVFLITFLTAAAALATTDKELLQLTAALGGTRWQVFRNVVVPSSLPWLISAAKLNIGFGLTGAVVGEFVAANEGIGYLLLYGAQIYDMSLVWAGILILVLVAMAMYFSVALLERWLLPWRES
jgi:NitT/TauT family transport system permease protein